MILFEKGAPLLRKCGEYEKTASSDEVPPGKDPPCMQQCGGGWCDCETPGILLVFSKKPPVK